MTTPQRGIPSASISQEELSAKPAEFGYSRPDPIEAAALDSDCDEPSQLIGILNSMQARNHDTDEAAERPIHPKRLEELYEDFLKDYLMQDLLLASPNQTQREKILNILSKMDHDTALDNLQTTICKICPSLVSELLRDQITEDRKLERASRDKWERDEVLGKYAPEIELKHPLPARRPGEADATPRQINYLNLLGLRDKAVLKSLGKTQASILTTEIKTLRATHKVKAVTGATQSRSRKATSATNSNQNLTTGIIFILALLIALIVAIARIVKA